MNFQKQFSVFSFSASSCWHPPLERREPASLTKTEKRISEITKSNFIGVFRMYLLVTLQKMNFQKQFSVFSFSASSCWHTRRVTTLSAAFVVEHLFLRSLESQWMLRRIGQQLTIRVQRTLTGRSLCKIETERGRWEQHVKLHSNRTLFIVDVWRFWVHIHS